jgi:hypothetical protein
MTFSSTTASSESVLLLTATVTPLAGLPALARTDHKVRMNDYMQTLGAYLDLLERGVFRAIVFVENSGAELSVLERMVKARGLAAQVEFISFDGLVFDPAKGRGYGEFLMVDHAMSQSSMLLLHPRATVWKCTGRYVVRTLEAIVCHARAGDLYCHCRDYPAPWCELYLLGWTRKGYEAVLRGAYRNLANDVVKGVHSTEEVLFRAMVDSAPESVVVKRRFRRLPRVEGVRGWNNASFDAGWNSPKNLLRRIFIRFLPFVWI